jgi:plastocyanin
MRMFVGAIIVAIAITAAVFVAISGGMPSEHVAVVLTEHGFVPSESTIKLGGTVTFSTDRDVSFWPASNLHPDHGLYPDFDPKRPLDPSETWAFTFKRAGDWAYHDHLRSYFTGVIHVVE